MVTKVFFIVPLVKSGSQPGDLVYYLRFILLIRVEGPATCDFDEVAPGEVSSNGSGGHSPKKDGLLRW